MANRNNNKKIIFKEATLAAKHILEMPKPATNHVPRWYKADRLFTNGNNDFMKSHKDQVDGTYKLCVPFVDALTAGYMFVTPCDIIVSNNSKDGYAPNLQWKVDFVPLDMQDSESLGSLPTPHDHNPTSFRWYTDWQVITPDGYSLWIMHPSNRYDLPFTTMSGFVDTDKHPSKLLFPFFIKNGFEGIIPEGTPIAQVIPVKRDIWKSEKMEYDASTNFIDRNIMKINMFRVYKNKFWSKKDYR